MRNLLLAFSFFISFILGCQTKQVPKASENTEELKSESTPPKPVAASIGRQELMEEELLGSLEQYVIQSADVFDSTLNDIIFKKRVFLEATKKGYTSDNDLKEELATYSKILSKDYLKDSTSLNLMIDEGYERLNHEINVSHIFISFSPDADPKDSTYVYEQLILLKNEANTKVKFDSLAAVHSHDKKTRDSGGNLGWVTGLQMLYEIENAAYNLKIGEVSHPVRSSVGYHLIRLNDKRANRGSVKVRHILKAIPSNSDDVFALNQKNKADSLLALLKNGADWNTVCVGNSDDNISKDSGGLLDEFGTFRRAEEEFEQVAFNLKKDEISKVVKSNAGYHILKGVSLKPLESKEKLIETIKSKIQTDSRGDYLEQQSLNQTKARLSYEINSNAFSEVLSSVDAKILSGDWVNSITSPKILIKTNLRSLSISEFLSFIADRQKYDLAPDGYTSSMAVRRYFRIFESKILKEIAAENATKWFPKLSHLINNLEEDMVVSAFLNDFVLEKSIADTIGHRRIYDQNINSYVKPKRRYAQVITASSKSFLENFKRSISEEKPYRLKRGIAPIYFSKNYQFLSDEDKRRLVGLFQILESNPNYIVEVGGNADINEEDNVSAARLQKVVSYLIELGVPITRIREFDYQKTRLVSKFDWAQNQRVSFQFFSNEELELLPSLDPNKTYLMGIETKWHEYDANSYLWQMNVGESKIQDLGNSSYTFTRVLKEQPEGIKSIKEVRSVLIQEYQKKLEEKLKAELEIKYPIKLNEEVINRLKSSLLIQEK